MRGFGRWKLKEAIYRTSPTSNMNYKRYFNKTSLHRKPSIIRLLSDIFFENPKEIISMAGGMPNDSLFPILSGTFKLRDGTSLTINETDMARALQYSMTEGFPELIEWIVMLQKDIHGLPLQNCTDERKSKTIITAGSQDGLSKVYEAVIGENDYILIETPCYSGTLCAIKPLRPRFLNISTDKDGIIPSELLRALSRWSPLDAKNPNSDIPKILFMVPTGGNPTGINYSLERKKEIYEIARTYDLLIIEDDPYYYLQFSKDYVPSFLSMDVDGRVLRSDSFSKLLSAGLRCGSLTGPKYVIEQILLHMQTSVVHASGLTQMLILRILEKWGLDGFKKHVLKVAEFYSERCRFTIETAEKYLKGIAEWDNAAGGMFLWLKLIGVTDTSQLIMEKAPKKKVLFLPGNAFSFDDTKPSPYIRVAFSKSSDKNIIIAFQRLAELVKEHRGY
ncbi:kynurenine/alpha-aminoadipate aminotransferase, mitochondrial isoform X2 [Octopus bimaculoides]|uniref:kynurenine/alpha-aminoadipate aminotransferase, mitochondrial isoform X2 n=1 Tax=Octopus bimaculoides TaxID=37653 RepID=UPI00071D2A6D|nr:kynurenine/alpha-aminoadipate aminotransferase, mitochondrial isoform X2 [Octopus bimaculoides]|eukprot:XP_014785033.1 PREDICTED: kynurenine/alpha-aminoadipate aminotransferase, mitochondrial-like isoform X2 [Octopus bimaculoides]